MTTVLKPGVATYRRASRPIAPARRGPNPSRGGSTTATSGSCPIPQSAVSRLSRLSDDKPASFAISTPHPPSGTLPYGGPPRSCRVHRAAGRHRAGGASDPGAVARGLDIAQNRDDGGVYGRGALDRALYGQRTD